MNHLDDSKTLNKTTNLRKSYVNPGKDITNVDTKKGEDVINKNKLILGNIKNKTKDKMTS